MSLLFRNPPIRPSSLPPPSTTRFRISALSLSPSSPPSVILVGAGLSGLAAALQLHSSNTPFLLLDASDAVGGRVRTDHHRGFLLDRGFQIFLTAYPEANRLLDYPSLDLRPFYAGSLVYFDGNLHRLSDPLRHPLHSLLSIPNPIGSLPDKLRIGLSRVQSLLPSTNLHRDGPDLPLYTRLARDGYSPSAIDRFFRPFFGGIFFDTDLETSSHLFDFVFRCLALGDNTLPAAGIGAIPQQLAGRLPPSSIRLNTKVESIDGRDVVLSGGEVVRGELGVIVAVDEPEAARLLPRVVSSESKKGKRSTACLYFAADKAAVEGPMLVLNGTGEGIVNNMCFPSSVARTYAPEGRALASVTVVGEREGTSDEDLTAEVVRELAGWLGEGVVGSWEHLRTYRIPYAQPDQRAPRGWGLEGKEPRVGDGVYLCGDHWSSSTFDGVLVSGRRAAVALLEDRGLLR